MNHEPQIPPRARGDALRARFDPTFLRHALILLAVAIILGRVFIERPVGDDLTSYLAAADVFSRGLDPYGPALSTSKHYAGLPYVYPPGTLYLIAWMAWVPAWVVMLIDGIARMTAIYASIAWAQREFWPERSPEEGVLIALTFAPLINALVQGNMVVYNFAALAWIWTCAATERTTRVSALRLFTVFLAGALIGFKPMWVIPVGIILALRRAWRSSFTTGLGIASVALLGLIEPGAYVSWLDRVHELREVFEISDLPTLSWPLYAAVCVVWTIASALAWTKRPNHPLLPLLACASVLVWPRVQPYTYIVMIPLWFHLMRSSRLGWVWWGLFALPIPFALRASGVGALEQILFLCATFAAVTWLFFTIFTDRPANIDMTS